MVGIDKVIEALHCPYKHVLLYALECVNLTDRERIIIDYIAIRGKTEEQASEELQNIYKRGYSVNSVHNYKMSALKKIDKAFTKMNIYDLLKEQD